MENKTPKPLIDLLTEKGKSQTWLAMKCQVADSTVTRWVSGHITPGMITRRYVEKVVGNPIKWGKE